MMLNEGSELSRSVGVYPVFFPFCFVGKGCGVSHGRINPVGCIPRGLTFISKMVSDHHLFLTLQGSIALSLL